MTGATGRTGRYVAKGLAARFDVVAGVGIGFEHPTLRGLGPEFPDVPVYESTATAIEKHHPDAVVDFTAEAAFLKNGPLYVEKRVPMVVGTTGVARAFLEDLGKQAKAVGIGMIVAPNFSIGAVLMMKFTREAAKHFPTAEIIEIHHMGKKDAPSGTALATALSLGDSPLKDESKSEEKVAGVRGGKVGKVHVHSLRLPGISANQKVYLSSAGEWLTIEHYAVSAEAYVPGVALALERVRSVQGLVFGLDVLL